MTDRFFVDRSVSRWESDCVWLAGDEAYHFSKVMRGNVGDPLILFDGSGLYAQGIVETIQKGSIQVRVTETFADDVESPLRLTVAAALPKGDRQRFLIEKLAELGVAQFVPILMERSVARANDAVIQRFRRYVIEAAKQCGRNVLMHIADEVPIDKLNTLFAGETISKFILHPISLGNVGQTTPLQCLTTATNNTLTEKILLLVGPEGSFTEREVEDVLRSGFLPLDLGKRILRTETACIAASAFFLTAAG